MRRCMVFVLIAACRFTPPALDDGIDGSSASDATPDGTAPLVSPSGYEVIGSSRYRIDTTGRDFWTQHDRCIADMVGATHLAVLTTTDEALAIRAHLLALGLSATRYHVGIAQDPLATSVDQGWVHLDGNPIAVALWSNFGVNGVEPDDFADTDELNHQEQNGTIDLSVSLGFLVDLGGGSTEGAVCECDGVPVSSTAQGFIDADPNNPN